MNTSWRFASEGTVEKSDKKLSGWRVSRPSPCRQVEGGASNNKDSTDRLKIVMLAFSCNQ